METRDFRTTSISTLSITTLTQVSIVIDKIFIDAPMYYPGIQKGPYEVEQEADGNEQITNMKSGKVMTTRQQMNRSPVP